MIDGFFFLCAAFSLSVVIGAGLRVGFYIGQSFARTLGEGPVLVNQFHTVNPAPTPASETEEDRR